MWACRAGPDRGVGLSVGAAGHAAVLAGAAAGRVARAARHRAAAASAAGHAAQHRLHHARPLNSLLPSHILFVSLDTIFTLEFYRTNRFD